jgi:uncharacterized protein (TIGR02145 family)
VTPEGEVAVSGTSDSWVETSNGDFNDGSFSQTYTTGNTLYTKKPYGATCTTNTQCSNIGGTGQSGGLCVGGICTDPWQVGPCAGIAVHVYDVPGTYMWKTTNTNCDTPQCGINGAQDGDNLVSDNSVDFSEYPARNICKTLGGRLPTRTELQCIYTNRAVYDDYGAFVANYFWSSTEGSTTNAYVVRFTNGYTGNSNKTDSYSVRCVRGQ